MSDQNVYSGELYAGPVEGAFGVCAGSFQVVANEFGPVIMRVETTQPFIPLSVDEARALAEILNKAAEKVQSLANDRQPRL